jgi:hypothetical protein
MAEPGKGEFVTAGSGALAKAGSRFGSAADGTSGTEAEAGADVASSGAYWMSATVGSAVGAPTAVSTEAEGSSGNSSSAGAAAVSGAGTGGSGASVTASAGALEAMGAIEAPTASKCDKSGAAGAAGPSATEPAAFGSVLSATTSRIIKSQG